MSEKQKKPKKTDSRTALIVDDEESILRVVERVLSGAGYHTLTSPRGDEALRIIESGPEAIDVVLLDLKMPGPGGMEVLKRIRLQYPEIEVIIMTGYGTVENAVAAVRLGAYDFLTKPFDSNEKLLISVEKALEHRELIGKTKKLEAGLGKTGTFQGLIGKNPKMQVLYQMIERLAPTDTTVLIQGESGTGKELVARALHSLSERNAKPFMAVNCSAITESLFESELFGHEKGSFTGATNRRAGMFEAANGGTIFLDEVSEIPLATQAKLLRVLQEGEVRRVGSNDSVKVNVRVITATNQELSRLTKEGKFREDLFYRLNVVALKVPALKERPDDIPVLVRNFLFKACDRLGFAQKQMSPEAMKILMGYSWSGNVRELENAIEHAVVVQKGEMILPADLPQEVLSQELAPLSSSDSDWEGLTNLSYKQAKAEALQRFHQVYFNGLLAKTGGNLSKASRIADLDRSNFRRIMKSSGLKNGPGIPTN